MERPTTTANLNIAIAVDAVEAALKAAQDARAACETAFAADADDAEHRQEQEEIFRARAAAAERKRAQRARGGTTSESIRARLCLEFIKAVEQWHEDLSTPQPGVLDVARSVVYSYPENERVKVLEYLGFVVPDGKERERNGDIIVRPMLC